MQVVIELTDEQWKCVQDGIWCGSREILNGIPLPKGHGRLVDADKYKAEIKRIFPCNDLDDLNIRRATEIALNNADTIIEADGGDAE